MEEEIRKLQTTEVEAQRLAMRRIVVDAQGICLDRSQTDGLSCTSCADRDSRGNPNCGEPFDRAAWPYPLPDPDEGCSLSGQRRQGGAEHRQSEVLSCRVKRAAGVHTPAKYVTVLDERP